jgi:predicted nucleic acid-binding Zn ribbon protein
MTCMVARFTVSANTGSDREGLGQAPPPHAPGPGSGLSTANGGKPTEPVDEGQPGDALEAESDSDDIARNALTQAQRLTRSSQSAHAKRRTRSRRRRAGDDAPSGYSGAGPDERDPQLLAGLLGGLVDERGWQRPLAEARVFADWASLVGADISSHCRPVALSNGELRIAAETTAWATQLQLISSALLASLVKQLGPEVVRRVFITGPTGPTWKHGGWSVRGARGPRDTYG